MCPLRCFTVSREKEVRDDDVAIACDCLHARVDVLRGYLGL